MAGQELGARYIVEGKLFQVDRLDFEGRKAFVQAVERFQQTRQRRRHRWKSLQQIEQVRTEQTQNVVAAWSQLEAARAQLQSDQVAVELAAGVLASLPPPHPIIRHIGIATRQGWRPTAMHRAFVDSLTVNS